MKFPGSGGVTRGSDGRTVTINRSPTPDRKKKRGEKKNLNLTIERRNDNDARSQWYRTETKLLETNSSEVKRRRSNHLIKFLDWDTELKVQPSVNRAGTKFLKSPYPPFGNLDLEKWAFFRAGNPYPTRERKSEFHSQAMKVKKE